MNILVTGGAGYIGSACVELLLNNNHKVAVYDSLISGHEEAVDSRAIFIKGCLSEREKLLKLFQENQYDAVMHFAAFSLVGESMTNPAKYFLNNLGYGINLLDAAVLGKIKSFVFSSTAATYGMPEEDKLNEESPQKPINPYGESKLCFEKVLKWYGDIYNFKYVALRYFNAAGASENFGEDHTPETHLIPIILQVAAGKRDKITIYGDDYPTEDGTCIRDYIHILDLANAHMLALGSDKSGFYNLGTGSGFTVKEVIESVGKVTGKEIKIDVGPRRTGDPAILIADSRIARKELKWNPKFEDINKIVSSAWEWKKKYPNGYT